MGGDIRYDELCLEPPEIMKSVQKKRGFTLIELLVVLAIIGILSAIVLASLNGARQKGRDARRISDVKQIQLALELYYDANSNFPTIASAPLTTTLLTAAGYITVVPTDPSGGTAAYGYFAYPSGCNNSGTTCIGYIIAAKLETNNSALSSSYVGGGPVGNPTMTINGASYTCSQNTSPNFIYCGAP